MFSFDRPFFRFSRARHEELGTFDDVEDDVDDVDDDDDEDEDDRGTKRHF